MTIFRGEIGGHVEQTPADTALASVFDSSPVTSDAGVSLYDRPQISSDTPGSLADRGAQEASSERPVGLKVLEAEEISVGHPDHASDSLTPPTDGDQAHTTADETNAAPVYNQHGDEESTDADDDVPSPYPVGAGVLALVDVEINPIDTYELKIDVMGKIRTHIRRITEDAGFMVLGDIPEGIRADLVPLFESLQAIGESQQSTTEDHLQQALLVERHRKPGIIINRGGFDPSKFDAKVQTVTDAAVEKALDVLFDETTHRESVTRFMNLMGITYPEDILWLPRADGSGEDPVLRDSGIAKVQSGSHATGDIRLHSERQPFKAEPVSLRPDLNRMLETVPERTRYIATVLAPDGSGVYVVVDNGTVSIEPRERKVVGNLYPVHVLALTQGGVNKVITALHNRDADAFRADVYTGTSLDETAYKLVADAIFRKRDRFGPGDAAEHHRSRIMGEDTTPAVAVHMLRNADQLKGPSTTQPGSSTY